MKLKLAAVLGLLAIACVTVSPAEACSRVLYHGPENTVLTGRTMDWMEDVKSGLWIFPRGMKRDGVFKDAPFEWASKYGSVIVSIFDAASVDGMNEKGLTANFLWLAESEYPGKTPGKPSMSLSAWLQYVLDSFSTVKEAVETLKKEEFSIVSVIMPGRGHPATAHLALSDSSGDSAIFEYVKGKLVIHHSRDHIVMTNSPLYEQQLALNAYWKEIGGLAMLPGTNRSADRFVRASFYLDAIPKTADIQTAVAGTFSVIRNISVPLGITTAEKPNISSTLWRTVSDHKNRVFYFESTTQPNIFWVDMKKIDFSEGTPTRALTLKKGQFYAGDTSSLFEEAEPFDFLGK
ncbi:MAG: linear amide C-N hydrolase [Aminobacteriaceae bacterium]